MHDQIIIALSGRKNAGKNTLSQIIGAEFYNLHNKSFYECSFADDLKRFCIDTLGLEEKQCYGSDSDKNTLTRYKWENVESFLAWKFGSRQFSDSFGDIQLLKGLHGSLRNDYYERVESRLWKPLGIRSGAMSGRDIMQLFGTELIRENFGNIWADATIRRIKRQSDLLATIVDNRFPNETESILNEPNGYVIRLTRSPFGFEDQHPSEASLDNFDWNRPKCFVLDNQLMSIEQQNEAVKGILHQILQEIKNVVS